MTVEELLKLDNAELNRLAAELVMGWKDCGTYSDHQCWHDDFRSVEVQDWVPATDRNQSGALLARMAERGAQIDVRFGQSGGIDIWSEKEKEAVSIPGNTARSETIAALAAHFALAAQSAPHPAAETSAESPLPPA